MPSLCNPSIPLLAAKFCQWMSPFVQPSAPHVSTGDKTGGVAFALSGPLFFWDYGRPERKCWGFHHATDGCHIGDRWFWQEHHGERAWVLCPTCVWGPASLSQTLLRLVSPLWASVSSCVAEQWAFPDRLVGVMVLARSHVPFQASKEWLLVWLVSIRTKRGHQQIRDFSSWRWWSGSLPYRGLGWIGMF